MQHRQLEVHWLSATDLLEFYKSGELTPTSVVESLLRRIENLNPLINAFTTINKFARLHAEYSTYRVNVGIARPLEGVPVAVKDLLDTDFLPTTYGSAIYRAHTPTRNSKVVQQLLDAGAIIIGKAATHEFAWGVTTDNPHFGPTRNPWDIRMVPGGSSGGSAAALAAGLAPLAIGTDTAGSIRIPSSLCGVTGLRPTHDTVSTEGVHALAPSLDAVGPMARTVADLRLLHCVLAPATMQTDRSERKLRVAAMPSFKRGARTERGGDAVGRALDSLAKNPQIEIVASPFDAPDLDPYELLSTIVLSEGLRTHTEAGTWPMKASDYGDDVRQRLEFAESLAPGAYTQALASRERFAETLKRSFNTVDALVGPIVNVSARKIEDRSAETETEFRSGVMREASPQSLTGLPSCAVPVGFSGGMPLGVQVTAGHGRDVDALQVAAAIEAELCEPQHPALPL
ncbi:amidase [Nocardioides sp. LS1]|uniref:amidase n=1 Tax=Nocardioides sp. LS1 TaxID=1027620 RepID=UPI000F61D72A|nr:amidase [Nocardioides sp. LS1]GCD88065.1 amidase [Nocardioides sp. LS1]